MTQSQHIVQNFCYKTDLNFISDDQRKNLLTFATSAPEKVFLTSQYQFRQCFTESFMSSGTAMKQLKLPDALEDSVYRKVPKYLQLDDLVVRIQIVDILESVDTSRHDFRPNIPPHIDHGRQAGMFFLLTDGDCETRFYDWKPQAPRELYKERMARPDQLDCKVKIRMEKGECWFFNHARQCTQHQASTSFYQFVLLKH